MNEGWQLYFSERVSWIASDLVLEKSTWRKLAVR